ncbi:MAG: hypothetical protein JST92_03360 [Deltaproteobacteria bacterium]|nr:hypothetical protein [Deltaproteobacteria bacterium]
MTVQVHPRVGAGESSFTIPVTVQDAPGFTASASVSSLQVTVPHSPQGPATEADCAFSVTLQPGHQGGVSLSAATLPFGTTATISPSRLTASGDAQVKLSVPASIPAGKHPVSLVATDDRGVQRATPIDLVVQRLDAPEDVDSGCSTQGSADGLWLLLVALFMLGAKKRNPRPAGPRASHIW